MVFSFTTYVVICSLALVNSAAIAGLVYAVKGKLPYRERRRGSGGDPPST